jgi:hypothetical protein
MAVRGGAVATNEGTPRQRTDVVASTHWSKSSLGRRRGVVDSVSASNRVR